MGSNRRGRGEENNEEFELNDVEDTIHGSVGSRLSLFSKELGFGRRTIWDSSSSALKFPNDCYRAFVVKPNGRLYRCWMKIVFLWSIYSTFFTPLEFGFFQGLPERLAYLESVQLMFLADVFLQFFVAYVDTHTYKMVYDRKKIARRYLKGSFLLDLLGCFPWDAIYKVTGKREFIRCLVLLRLWRATHVTQFFKRLEKDIRINYLFTRIVKLITVELYCTHTAACIFYYLATTLPPSQEGYTWIGSLTLGDYNYINFREIDFWRRYITSLYFAIVTMATVGYGDIHAVNNREMIFIMIYISFDMVLSAYLIGNMTALIVKGSKTERFRDKMTDVIKYMNRNKLDKDIRSQVTSHLRLQYESTYAKASILEDIPIAVRSQISQSLYFEMVQKVPLFGGCSDEFLNQIVTKLNEEFFLPGEIIMEQGSAVDQIYIISHGCLEELVIGEDGTEEFIAELLPMLLRIEKQAFAGTLKLYFKDSRQILGNLLKSKETDLRIRQLESDITYLISKQEAELALRVNSAAYHGDLYHLKGLINTGADPNKTDYDGRTPLHMAASKGFEDIVRFLIQRGANIKCIDMFGNSPLLEAVKGGHDKVAALLSDNGAILNLEDAGSYMCKVVLHSKIEVLRRLLENGVDPNSKNYDHRTPLHVAASEGLHLVANVLIQFGADVLSQDRWGNTPLHEGQRCGSRPLLKILEQARNNQVRQ